MKRLCVLSTILFLEILVFAQGKGQIDSDAPSFNRTSLPA